MSRKLCYLFHRGLGSAFVHHLLLWVARRDYSACSLLSLEDPGQTAMASINRPRGRLYCFYCAHYFGQHSKPRGYSRYSEYYVRFRRYFGTHFTALGSAANAYSSLTSVPADSPLTARSILSGALASITMSFMSCSIARPSAALSMTLIARLSRAVW